MRRLKLFILITAAVAALLGSGTVAATFVPPAAPDREVAASPPPHMDRIVTALERAAPTAEDEQRAHEDVEAQKAMASWAERTFWATALQVVIGAASVVLVLRSLGQSRDAINASATANGIAQDNHISERRAWLEVTSADVADAELGVAGLRFDLNINIRNVGSGPARNIWVDLVVVPEPEFVSPLLINETRERIRKDPVSGEGVIFPGAVRTMPVSVTVLRPVLENIPAHIGDLRYLKVLFVGAVRYDTIFESEKAKLSGFAFCSHEPAESGILVGPAADELVLGRIALKPASRGWYAD